MGQDSMANEEQSSSCRHRSRRRKGAIWPPRGLAADTVVAVARNQIDWLDRAADRFQVKAKLDIEFPTAVACFPVSKGARNAGGLYRRHDCPCRSAAIRAGKGESTDE